MDAVEAKYRHKTDEQLAEALSLQALDDKQWKRVKLKKGVLVQKRKYKDTGFNIVKGSVVMPFPFEAVWRAGVDISLRTRVDKTVGFAAVLRMFGEDMRFVHIITNKVAVVSPRNFVTCGVEKTLSDRARIQISTSVDPSDWVLDGEKGTRGLLHLGSFYVEKVDDNNTKVIYMACADPKGKILKSLVNNSSSRSVAYLGRLREFLEKGVIDDKDDDEDEGEAGADDD